MASSAHSARAQIIARLAQPADLRTLPLPVLHIVMAMRLAALFDRAGRDLLGELATRLGSVTAAEQLLSLGQAIVRTWPEHYVAGRPCCMRMTPDERTVAGMAQAASRGDRDAFARELQGFVRQDRHDDLFGRTVRCLAELSALYQRV